MLVKTMLIILYLAYIERIETINRNLLQDICKPVCSMLILSNSANPTENNFNIFYKRVFFINQ